MRDGGAESAQEEQTGGEAGVRAVGCKFTFQTLHSTSQDGLSLEFVSATAGRDCNIQDARGGGLCWCITLNHKAFVFLLPGWLLKIKKKYI